MSEWDASDPFAEARRRSGVLVGDFLGEKIALILRYKDVRDAASDFLTYSSDAPFRVPIPTEERVRKVRQLPIEVDPPEHTDYKAIVQPYFSVSKRPKMEKKIGALIGEMIDEVLDTEPVEIINEFALPLQSRALTVLLRMPMEAAEEWIGWGLHVFAGSEGHSEEKGSILDRYLHRQLDRAETAPGDDLFSALTTATFRGRPLTRDEMVGFANLVFAGGRDTVIATVSLTLAHFAAHPGDLVRLRNDPLLLRNCVEEIVRIASPLTMIARVCPHDTNVHGVQVPADHRVALCWASANRDDTVFESPERLIIDRKPNPHVAFGAGPHICLGASYARLILRTLISQVSRKVSRMDVIDSEPRYEAWPAYRRQTSFESLRIRFG
ncbi:MAG: cytochrome P450 [Rhodospirillaceae bacterium]|nr:cytochrome P450 [Rhodospirillaceae bacterium]MDE0363769.1 cytochrome P450 [Rhodospirillaceae bacterium]